MEAKIINGRDIASEIRLGLKNDVERLKENGVQPGLAVVIVGDDPASRIYVNNKKKACEEIGIRSFEYALPADDQEG